MTTLLLRLEGPMQSWGTQSRFSIRDTGLEPSKSGVIGLLCAALGKPRQETENDGFPTIEQLVSLRMGVRVDREGVFKRDFHTAGGAHKKDDEYGVIKADGKSRGTVTSDRYYLSDANFLVGLEGERGLLEILHQALEKPHWQLCLGRKAFVPGSPIWLEDGLQELALEETFEKYPFSTEKKKNEESRKLRIVLDRGLNESQADESNKRGTIEIRQDVPVSFASRCFKLRSVITRYISIDDLSKKVKEEEDVPI